MKNDAEPLWTPDPGTLSRTQMHQFVIFLVETEALPDTLRTDYSALHRWSIEQADRFWSSLWEWHGVRGDRGSDTVCKRASTGLHAHWFPDAQLNFAENLLHGGLGSRDLTAADSGLARDQIALVAINEDGQRRSLTRGDLQDQSAALAATLRAHGVTRGDRIAAVLPNGPEAVIAMLASARLGATFTSCSPDFGLQGLKDRFCQTTPSVLITTAFSTYAGRSHDLRARACDLARALLETPEPQLKLWIQLGESDTAPINGLSTLEWAAALQASDEALAGVSVFERFPFSQPLYILYSSGTTGQPKAIMHGAGGTLLQHLKELRLHTDVRQDDRLFYYTTCGWMMWNWLVSGLATGATLVLYDGSPVHPDAARLWDLAMNENLSHFGASARFYAGSDKAALKPRDSHDLSSLRCLLSTGSPLAPETFDYLHRDVSSQACISSISGGTDIVSCFALGHPGLPVWRGELQCAGLGMDLGFVDANGKALRSGKGELVCSSPFPSMPVGFWNDPDGERYQKAYFRRFPGLWAHGDFGEFIEHPNGQTGVVIHGRSDATLNPGGVRIGTAELYRQVERFPEVMESLAIGQPLPDGDERIILFVCLRTGVQLDAELERRLRQGIREGASPRHVPALILQVPDLPRTRSGKLVELDVRQVVAGETIANVEALANPEALDHFRNLRELQP